MNIVFKILTFNSILWKELFFFTFIITYHVKRNAIPIFNHCISNLELVLIKRVDILFFYFVTYRKKTV